MGGQGCALGRDRGPGGLAGGGAALATGRSAAGGMGEGPGNNGVLRSPRAPPGLLLLLTNGGLAAVAALPALQLLFGHKAPGSARLPQVGCKLV